MKLSNDVLAVVRVRGQHDVKPDIEATLKMLRLHRKNYCAVFNNSPSMLGMLGKVKDYVTYGNLDSATLKELVGKRGEQYNGPTKDSKGKITYNKFIEADAKKYKRYFRLAPPAGGFEKKGVKVPFSSGGVLGNRKEKINVLIRKML